MKSILKRIVVGILTWEAQMVLKKYKPKVVGITGSVGKTSTKDAIYTVLASKYDVGKSQKSFNSEIGIPLTILGCDNAWSNPLLWLQNILKGLWLIVWPHKYPEWLVLEVGLDAPGDISRTVAWLSLDVAVFTRLPRIPVHVEFFESPEALRAEKKRLVDGLTSEGILVINKDDDYQKDIVHPHGGTVVTHGVSEGSDVRGSHIEISYKNETPDGMQFDVTHKSKTAQHTVSSIVGDHFVYPVLAALGVGLGEGIELEEALKALSTHTQAPGRMRILTGKKDTTLIDDTYNASPVAVKEALKTLKRIETKGRKIAVLGDMMELGTHATKEHREAGKQAVSSADILVTVGPRAQHMATGAREAGVDEKDVFECISAERAARQLEEIMQEGDLILIKGSQSMRMERTTAQLLAEPEKAAELLVRHDPVWLARK